MANYKSETDFILYDDYWKYITERNLKESQERYKIEAKQRHEMRRLSTTFQIIALCAFLCLGFSGMVVQSAAIYQTKYENHVLKSEIRDLQLEIEELNAHIDNAVSLQHVESVALNELKMQYPQQHQVVYVALNWDYTLEENMDETHMAVIEKTPTFAAKFN